MSGHCNILSCFKPLLSTEERESAGQTLPVPEVGKCRGARETPRSDRHDQVHQAVPWQLITEGHAHCGPLQVRHPRTISSDISNKSVCVWPWPYPGNPQPSFSTEKNRKRLSLLVVESRLQTRIWNFHLIFRKQIKTIWEIRTGRYVLFTC